MNLVSKALRMARVNEGSHSFTCHQRVCTRLKWATHSVFTPSRRASLHFGWYSFLVPQRVGGWVGLGSWLHTEVVCLLEDGQPSQKQPADSAAADDQPHDHWVARSTP